MNKLTEAIDKALQDDEINEMIKTKVDELSETKAKEIANKYIDILEGEAEKYIDEKVTKLTEKVSNIIEECIGLFVDKYKNAFNVYENELKIEAILESLSTVCKLAGVNAEMITNEVNNQRTQNESILNSKLSSLKNILDEERNAGKLAKRDYERSLNEKDEEINELKSKIHEKDIKYAEVNEEKNNIAKLGIIAEMKQNMSLKESKMFEKNAMNIPFTMDKDYINKLNYLKDSIKEENLNEVTNDETNENNVTKNEKWFNKYV